MKLSVMFGAAVIASACGAQQHRAQTLPTTAATVPTSNEPAIRVLSQRRCALELACGRVGPGRRFPNEAACTVSTEIDQRASIGVATCPFGVDPLQVSRCLVTLDALSCTEHVGTLADVADCRPFEMCESP